MSYFCPKRFNRFPRFTIFFKKGRQTEQSCYEVENTVSLNANVFNQLVNRPDNKEQEPADLMQVVDQLNV